MFLTIVRKCLLSIALGSTRCFLLLCRYKFTDKFRTEKSNRVDVKYFRMGHVGSVLDYID